VKSVAQSFVMRARGVKQTDLAPLHEPHGEIAPGGSLPFKFTPVEEGYGRLTRVEYVRFLDIARGSARETRGRYERMTNWLDQEVIQQRVELLDEIIGILTTSIETMRKKR